MTVYYEVFHELNPRVTVVLAFKEEQTPIRVKDKACKDGYFSWRDYTELRVKKSRYNLKLEEINEVSYADKTICRYG